LEEYRAKRDFARTPEPQGAAPARGTRLAFVVQRHDATRLHYDLRLEWGGVLKSWAVTKGPSMDPADKRLAVQTEDHPLDYAGFEGTIPKGQYGGGTVQIFDRGAWAPVDPDHVDRDLAKGELKFVVAGQRLRGGFVLVRMKPRPGDKRANWLLIKERDSTARPGEGDTVLEEPTSAATGHTLGAIADAQENAFIEPQLCTLVETPPRGPGWVHELKLDGYRLQLIATPERVTLHTRTGLDWTARFPAIAAAARALRPTRGARVLDGEAVALDEGGQPDFALLQAVLAHEAKAPLVYYAFDLLRDGADDLRTLALLQRKARLRDLVPRHDPTLRFLDHFAAPGEAVLASACRLAMEGVVSKRVDGAYASGRGEGWVKAKCRGRDEFVIGGWFAGSKGGGFGALLVGARRAGRLVYLGRVGTGFSAATAQRLLDRLRPLARPDTPFDGKGPARTRGITWVAPELVAEVAYAGWTEAGLLRQASFVGLREDKPAAEVAPPDDPPRPRPRAARRAGPALSHPDRVLWPASGDVPALTKADLAEYYRRNAARLLAHVGGRPLSILRAPDGIGAATFFQRHAMPGQSPLIGSVAIQGQAKPFLRIDDEAALLALAQISAVELHPWGAKADAPDVPDRLVFDLDPAEGVDFAAVIEAALELRTRLEGLGLACFAKVTGGKGLHVTVPLDPAGDALGWPEAKQFARLVCTMMARDAPGRYTVNMSKKKREGRIFLDYLRNDRLATVVAAWSPRGRAGAPVARPVAWSAVKPGLRPDSWHLPDAAGRDPWPLLDGAAVPLREAVEKVTRK
jgi:bifunctional non-homologous end joining protein LigD